MQTPTKPLKPFPHNAPCNKTCAPGSVLNPKSCKCEQKAIGPENTTFNSNTGRFDRKGIAVPKTGKPPMKKGGSVIKGSSMRRQASVKGLRNSKTHK
jgi:hypothetical protein